MKRPLKLRNKFTLLFIVCSLTIGLYNCSEKQDQTEKVKLFEKKLSNLIESSDNKFFTRHVESILQVINADKPISKKETEFLGDMYDIFINDSLANPSDFNSYLNRKRILILAWVSPTDSVVSFSWLRLPKDWDATKEYPLYVNLHGLWDVAATPISYMSFPYTDKPLNSTSFEDGYALMPWGRGNKWYHDISKTDIWESITELEKIVKVDPNRKYLSGHSMGGYGVWHIAQESASTWAAIGIHSGALWYKDAKYVTPAYANKLRNTPTYFVWGDEESELKKDNIKAHQLLEKAGNPNLKIAVFNGGHDYNEIDIENMYKWMRTYNKE